MAVAVAASVAAAAAAAAAAVVVVVANYKNSSTGTIAIFDTAQLLAVGFDVLLASLRFPLVPTCRCLSGTRA